MVADVLTKALPREAFEKFREALGVVKVSRWVGVLKIAIRDRFWESFSRRYHFIPITKISSLSA